MTKEEWEQYKDLEYYPDRFCKCGCGGRIKVKSHHKWYGIPEYVYGHNRGHSGYKHTDEVKQRNREAHLGKNTGPRPEEVKRKISIGNSGKKRSEEVKKKRSESQKQLWEDPEYRKNQIEAHTTLLKEIRICAYEKCNTTFECSVNSGRKYCSPRCSVEFHWQDPRFVKMMIEAHHRKPNKPEKFLDELLQKLFSNQWKYTGDGQDENSIIGGKCPDFVHVKRKKIIEHFGIYWHGEERTGISNEQHEQERIDLFTQHGYQTLIIWEHELSDISTLVSKLLVFNKGDKLCQQI